MVSRRGFLRQASIAAAFGTVGVPLARADRSAGIARAAVRDAGAYVVDPDMVRALALHAVDAASAEGVDFADVHLTRTLSQNPWNAYETIGLWAGPDTEMLGVGVRVLVNGAWGFAASGEWSMDEVVRLAREAVAQARANAGRVPRHVTLDAAAAVTGSWATPIIRDPFLVSLDEKLDFAKSIAETAKQLLPRRTRTGGPAVLGTFEMSFSRQERAIATTDGTYVTQTVYASNGDLVVYVMDRTNTRAEGSAAARGLGNVARGWEIFPSAKLLDQLPSLVARAEAIAALPAKPVDVGRYDIVCDAPTMGRLIGETIGAATQLDLALGYEANAGGTSYLGPDPFAMLGTSVASPLVTLTANRSRRAGLATVQWDAEGVMPSEFPLVSQGVLVDYQTTREQAAWLAPWYQRHGGIVRSHGCAEAANALSIPMQMMPNLALAPSPSAASLDDLIAGTGKGVALLDSLVQADFQRRNGGLDGGAYEIRDGKLSAKLLGADVSFASMPLWKSLTALGGAESVEDVGQATTKGQPEQTTLYTVSAVPAAFKNVAIFDRNPKPRLS
jgi:TldD protein